MIKVMCFGTFDILHPGHLDYLSQAKKLGDKLVVVIARDRTKTKQKEKIIFNEKERLQLIKSLKIVDQAFLGDKQDHLKIIKKIKPQIICLGYDHKITIPELKKSLFPLRPKIKRLKPYHQNKYKSTKIRNKLKKL